MEKLIQLLLALPNDISRKIAAKDPATIKHLQMIEAEMNRSMKAIEHAWRKLSKEQINADIYLPILKKLIPDNEQQLQALSNRLNDLGELTDGSGISAVAIAFIDQAINVKQFEIREKLTDQFDLQKMKDRLPSGDKQRAQIEKYLQVAAAVTSPATAFFKKHTNADSNALKEASYQDILSRTSQSDGKIDTLKKERIDFWLEILDLQLAKNDIQRAQAILDALESHKVNEQLKLYNLTPSAGKKSFPEDTLKKYEALKNQLIVQAKENEVRQQQATQNAKQLEETIAKKTKKSAEIDQKNQNKQFGKFLKQAHTTKVVTHTSGKITSLLKSSAKEPKSNRTIMATKAEILKQEAARKKMKADELLKADIKKRQQALAPQDNNPPTPKSIDVKDKVNPSNPTTASTAPKEEEWWNTEVSRPHARELPTAAPPSGTKPPVAATENKEDEWWNTELPREHARTAPTAAPPPPSGTQPPAAATANKEDEWWNTESSREHARTARSSVTTGGAKPPAPNTVMGAVKTQSVHKDPAHEARPNKSPTSAEETFTRLKKGKEQVNAAREGYRSAGGDGAKLKDWDELRKKTRYVPDSQMNKINEGSNDADPIARRPLRRK